jgi:hypothetical protein
MSSMVLDHQPLENFVRQAPAGRGVAAHPRGRGFGVLSRIARVGAEETAYSPRHRLAAPVDGDSRSSMAG